MTKTVSVSIIGLGMWGRRMAAAVNRSPYLNLVNCYARSEYKRKTFSKDFDCLPADSFESAISNDAVEAVLLVTPNEIHAEQTLACAKLGKHVFVEKPIAYTVEDAQKMEQACLSAGVTLFTGHSFRRLGASRKVKAILEEGKLGKVVLVEANFSLPGNLTPDKWRYYRDTCPGGPLMQLGIHHIDTLHYWLGSIKKVQGSFAHLVTPAEIDDIGTIQLEFENGTRGLVASSYVSPKTFSLRLYGTNANLHYVTDMSIWPDSQKMDLATTLTLQTSSGLEELSFPKVDMLTDELEAFARSIREGTQPETGAPEGSAALKIILSAIQSSKTGVSIIL